MRRATSPSPRYEPEPLRPRPTLREVAGRVALLCIWLAAETLLLLERLVAAARPATAPRAWRTTEPLRWA